VILVDVSSGLPESNCDVWSIDLAVERAHHLLELHPLLVCGPRVFALLELVEHALRTGDTVAEGPDATVTDLSVYRSRELP